MARQPHEYIEIHKAADKIEERVARSLARGFEKTKDQISINQLMIAIQNGSPRTVMKLVRSWNLDDPLRPAANILRDAVLRGGRLGAKALNREGAIKPEE